MKKTDIPEVHFTRAAEFAVEASRRLRESGEGRWWDNDYANWINDLLFSGRFWRRVARINSVEDAQRELLDIAAGFPTR